MASQEHLQQLTRDDDDSSSSSTSVNSTDDEEEEDEDDHHHDNSGMNVPTVTATATAANSQNNTEQSSSSLSSSLNDSNGNMTSETKLMKRPLVHSMPPPPPKRLMTAALSKPALPLQQPQTSSTTSSSQPKMRIKLSMRRLPTKALAAENAGRAAAVDPRGVIQKKKKALHHQQAMDEDDDIKATIVEDSDEADVDVVAALVEGPSSPQDSNAASSTAASKAAATAAAAMAAASSANKRQRGSNPIQRSIRLPPLSSPGLLLPPTSGVFRGAADSKGFATPSSVFDHAMSLAGYTTESRTLQPHRGSSVKRGVGDMFDSNVKLSLHFPELVPQDLWTASRRPTNDEGPFLEQNGSLKELSYAELLLRNLSEAASRPTAPVVSATSAAASHGAIKTLPTTFNTAKTSRKRRRPLPFDEMIPVSLTLPYPESYIQKRLEYVEAVQQRENAIIAFQEAEEAAEIAQERHEEALLAHSKKGTTENGAPEPPTLPPPIEIPPIPEPPSPPHLKELEGFPVETISDDHPRYFPKDKEFLVAHLDRDCFHITEGRYFALMSSQIADPLFVGPNAPGVTGSLTASTGLATVNAGSSSLAAAASSAHSPGNNLVSTATAATADSVSGKSAGGPSKESGASSAKKQLHLAEAHIMADDHEGLAAVASLDDTTLVKAASSKKKKKGPTPTATSSSLRKIMEDGGEEAELMKNCIIRAAVYASRAGTHGQSFVGCNGETYPDISKAFAAHAGLKPCNRCKTNKQGAYHCRLRRKHKDLDYDGGNSPAVLAPLFFVPAEELLWKKP